MIPVCHTDFFSALFHVSIGQISTLTSWPVDTLGSKTGGGQDFLDMTLPAGGLQFTQPAVHVVRLVIARLHKLDQTLLEDIRPEKRPVIPIFLKTV